MLKRTSAYQRGIIDSGLRRAKGARLLVVMALCGLAGAVMLGGDTESDAASDVNAEIAPKKLPPILEMRYRSEAVASLAPEADRAELDRRVG